MNGIRWITDGDGDYGISFFNILILLKYKKSVLVQWFKNYKDAPRWLMSGDRDNMHLDQHSVSEQILLHACSEVVDYVGEANSGPIIIDAAAILEVNYWGLNHGLADVIRVHTIGGSNYYCSFITKVTPKA